MSFNTFGKFFRFTTWGESHGPSIGCVIDGCPPNIPISEKDIHKRRERLEELMAEFSIEHLRTAPALALSGGERRRVEIARSLAANPKYLLLDEPFAGIDPIAIEDIKNILTSLSKKGISILITDHNIRETITLCKRSIIISNGEILAEGSANELIHNEKVKVHYFGEMFDKP